MVQLVLKSVKGTPCLIQKTNMPLLMQLTFYKIQFLISGIEISLSKTQNKDTSIININLSIIIDLYGTITLINMANNFIQ